MQWLTIRSSVSLKACFSSLAILFVCDSSFSENTRQTKSYCAYLEGNANKNGKYYSGENPVHKNPDDNWSHDIYKPTTVSDILSFVPNEAKFW